MIQTDVNKAAEELLEWMEDHGSAPNRPSMAYGLLETHLPVFLLNYREQCRNEVIEFVAMHFQTILTQLSNRLFNVSS